MRTCEITPGCVHLECVDCGNPKVENQETGLCGSCGARHRKAARLAPVENNQPVNKVSEKQAQWNTKYFRRIRTWKRGKKCQATFPHECSPEIECHHMQGRSINVFHDEWAEENNIPELMDERFWMPLCPEAHRYVTVNSRWAAENGYLFLKVTDPVFRTKTTEHGK